MNVVPATHRAKKLAIHIGPDGARRVGTMLERQNLNKFQVSQRELASGAIGCLGIELPVSGDICFFTGAPINGPDVKELVDADTAARLFPSYDGPFAGVFWDARREVLTVATDCLGMQPLYIGFADGELILTSDTKAINGEPDLSAWGAFISMGHPIGKRSLMHGLQRVPPATILTYDVARRQLETRRYWQWPEPSDAWRDFDFLTSLERDLHAYTAFGNTATLLLSGGFDSRLFLFLLQRAGISASGLIVAHEDEFSDADGRLAEAIAESTGLPFRKAYPPLDFFSSPAYLDYLKVIDAGFPSLDLFIAKVVSQVGCAAVWEGLIPAIAFNTPHQVEGGFDSYRKQEIRGPESGIWRAAQILFKPEALKVMFTGFSEDLEAEISRQPQDMHGVLRFIIENRSRNRIAMNPLKAYANYTDAFTPGLSKDLMAHASVIPFSERKNAKFYRSMLAQLDNRSLKVPFLSGGELVRGNRMNPSYYRERWRASMATCRTRHPRLFLAEQASKHARSSFLGRSLCEDNDQWLNPNVGEKLKTPGPENYLAWKLLFHWKAWRWVHDGRLEQILGSPR